jgi:hypothetical protein
MALSFGIPDIMRFRRRAITATKDPSKVRQKISETLGTVITTTEVSATAFAFGLIQGKYGGVALANVPIDAIAGLGLHLFAFTPWAGNLASHVHALGDGALASFVATIGRQVGRGIQTDTDRQRIADARAGLLTTKSTVLGLSGGASLADQELARMVAASTSR